MTLLIFNEHFVSLPIRRTKAQITALEALFFLVKE